MCLGYYLSTMPQLYSEAIQRLGEAGLADDKNGSRRVIIEKPFGTDTKTAERLNESIHQVFREDQIYRIDHYLGKETVQNIFALRFANSIFEPLWNRRYVDHVQITVAEEVLVGRRGGYYDESGILRDMFQNHLLQLLMITAMEPPARYDANLVRDEKVKVLHCIRKMSGGEFRLADRARAVRRLSGEEVCLRIARRLLTPRSSCTVIIGVGKTSLSTCEVAKECRAEPLKL